MAFPGLHFPAWPQRSGHGLPAVRCAENTLFAGSPWPWARALLLDTLPCPGLPGAHTSPPAGQTTE